jgi:hypothetical protein
MWSIESRKQVHEETLPVITSSLECQTTDVSHKTTCFVKIQVLKALSVGSGIGKRNVRKISCKNVNWVKTSYSV